MTREEYEQKIEEEQINLDRLQIIIGRISKTPYTTGCYKDGELWEIYKVGERQNFVVVKEGNEDEIFQTMYRVTKGMLKQWNDSLILSIEAETISSWQTTALKSLQL